uniref:Amine oxidase domain-containing protein n=1 Tax=viral metagenome TaxID=1070528 RepID=A0A6C0IEC4_9ZZZZ
MIYDYCIIGGGIAGLYCALKLIEKNSVLLCEKYSTLGGRVSTFYKNFHKGSLQYEEGAGRISNKHILVINLIKKYNLTLIPISPDLHYKQNGSTPITENLFEPALNTFLGPLHNLSESVLQKNTIRNLLEEIHGKAKTDDYLNRFPYRAEVDVLRADVGLEVFRNEMGSHEGYYVVKEGLSALIKCMKDEFIEKGGKLANEYECINIHKKEDNFVSEFLSGKNKKLIHINSEKVICALPSEALKKISLFKNYESLKYVKMEPLLRIYANYPSAWFSALGRIVTERPIRYFLPMNGNLAMVSYTDSKDTELYHNIIKNGSEDALGLVIQKDLKELFPTIEIPKYTFFKSHYWKYGATYWIPGTYDVKKESLKSIKPFKSDVFVVGESFSLKQAWMEGSLEQCEVFFKTYM